MPENEEKTPATSILTEEEKTRIIETETLKNTVQKELQAPNKLSQFLNYPFTLWVLSTVVVGLVTFAYQQISKNKEASGETKVRVYNITKENDFRNSIVNNNIGEYEDKLQECKSKITSKQEITLENLYDLTRNSLKIAASIQMVGIYSSPYPKYDKSGEMWEMHDLTEQWRFGMNDFHILNAFNQLSFEHSSETDIKVESAILEGTISKKDIENRVQIFDSLTRNLKNSMIITDSLKHSFDLVYEAKTLPNQVEPNIGKKIAENPQESVQLITNWTDNILENWKRFCEYKF